ncbi:hypothetical protein ECPA49_2484, partial [Escherichia coli PA49]
RAGTAALPVHLKTAAVNRVCLIFPPLPGDRLPFFIQLITEKIPLTALHRQVNFPEHHPR